MAAVVERFMDCEADILSRTEVTDASGTGKRITYPQQGTYPCFAEFVGGSASAREIGDRYNVEVSWKVSLVNEAPVKVGDRLRLRAVTSVEGVSPAPRIVEISVDVSEIGLRLTGDFMCKEVK